MVSSLVSQQETLNNCVDLQKDLQEESPKTSQTTGTSLNVV